MIMDDEAWVPRTELGRKVQEGSVTSIRDIMEKGIPILETNIVDLLLPDLDSEILDINRVQRRDRSGRKLRYRVVVAIGNRDGYVGIGVGKAKEVYGGIQKAIQNAKKNIICVRRGCGSWECGCRRPHTVPFRVTGKSGSVEVSLLPAPQGVDLAAGDVAKTILQLAGIEDAWSRVSGNTQTTLNFAMAVFNALKKTNSVQAVTADLETLGVMVGEVRHIEVRKPEVPKVDAEKVARELRKEGAVEEELESVEAESEDEEESDSEDEEESDSEEAQAEGEPDSEDEELESVEAESEDEEESDSEEESKEEK
jgi:small subunit ribosomal protein S5